MPAFYMEKLNAVGSTYSSNLLWKDKFKYSGLTDKSVASFDAIEIDHIIYELKMNF